MKKIFNTLKDYIKNVKAIIIGAFIISILAFLITLFLGLNDIIYYSNFNIIIILEVITALVLAVIIVTSIYKKIEEEVIDIQKEQEKLYWKEFYQKYDSLFIDWIPNEEKSIYEKTIEQIGKGKVCIHTYPNYNEQSALLQIGTEADVTKFFKVLEQIKERN